MYIHIYNIMNYYVLCISCVLNYTIIIIACSNEIEEQALTNVKNLGVFGYHHSTTKKNISNSSNKNNKIPATQGQTNDL